MPEIIDPNESHLREIREALRQIEDAIYGYTSSGSGIMVRLDRLEQRATRLSACVKTTWGAIVAVAAPTLALLIKALL